MSHGEQRWVLRASSTSKARTTVFARSQQFDVGLPLSFDEAYEGVTALEHALGALAADLAGGLHAAARRRRLDLDRVETLVDARLGNPLVPLGVVGEGGDPGLAAVSLKVFASSTDEAAAVREAWDEALTRSVLYATFAKSARIDLDLRITL